MHDIVNPDLAARFESHAQEPDHREPVVVSSDQPVTRETLEASGMTVAFVSSEGTIASGTADRASVSKLAEVEGVTLIEADTEMHALED
jgi:hypothetical protein